MLEQAIIPITIVSLYICMSAMWILYLAVMSLKLERDELKAQGRDFTLTQKIFGYPVLIVMIVADVVFNWVIGSILFVELPREFLFTSRCQRHMKDNSFRGKLARSFCKHLLDPFEIGGHC